MANKHINEIIKGASSALVIKIVSAGVTFLFYLYLGRVLGAESAGIFFLGLTVLTIGSVIGRFGLENTVLRIVAKESYNNNWGLILSSHKKCMQIAFVFSLFTAMGVFFTSEALSVILFSSTEMVIHLEVISISIVPLALSVVNAQAIQGLKRIKESTIILNLSVPLIALIGAMILISKYSVLGVVIAYTVSIILTYFASLYLWKKIIPKDVCINKTYETKKILDSCIPLFWVSVMQMTINWLSFIVLGIYSTEADVGVLGMAIRVVTLMGFFLMAVNSITAPKIAEMYKSNNHSALENMCRSASTILLYITLPFGLIIFIFADTVLGLFGSEFLDHANVLQILVFGQFANIITGSVGILLIMSGNEKVMRNNLFITMLLCIVMNIVLIPEYGLVGAAISFSLSMAIQNIISLYKVKKIMNIYTLPFINPLKVIKGV
ncbi:MAG: hypothetical protein DIZ80_12985 [endosymbiont of Galathealinum brachiosum]|uniref:Uncharacterized protein n=1 Tax=endosymbiont of Galathealinum brachiosum TaxID=2200906 RepID=A0A370D7X4_9GAMM|nr:MAG: hypothetical protein DIZ80_12985 [endosymbiont of Galathealinum brachiosum]